MDDPYEKIFEVGDFIKPNKGNEEIFLESYKFEPPLTVLKVFLNAGGNQWLLNFRDTNGRTNEAGWYHFRFEPVFVSYNPEQTGDTDDDV